MHISSLLQWSKLPYPWLVTPSSYLARSNQLERLYTIIVFMVSQLHVHNAPVLQYATADGGAVYLIEQDLQPACCSLTYSQCCFSADCILPICWHCCVLYCPYWPPPLCCICVLKQGTMLIKLLITNSPAYCETVLLCLQQVWHYMTNQ